MPPQVIPPVHTTVLTGAKVDLPEDLHGRTTVLVLGFSQQSRGQVSAWGKRLAREYERTPDVRWFEMAELESIPRLLRSWVAKKIKESVSAQGQKTFLILTDHEREWKQIAAFTQVDDAYVLVVDATGAVHARAQGAVTDAAYAQVQAAIDRLRTAR